MLAARLSGVVGSNVHFIAPWAIGPEHHDHERILSMTTPAELLLAQAQTQLTRQEAKLTAFRTTAGTVIGTGGIVAGLVATRLSSSISAAGLVFAALAAVAFFSGIAAAIKVLAPKGGYTFSENLASYTSWLDTHGASPGADTSFALGLATNLNKDRTRNEPLLNDAANALYLCCLLLGVQVAFWVIAVLVA
jgi:hypothetical protein